MPLHLKYRPMTLDQVYGNKSIIDTINGIFKRQSDYPHCWLFYGPRGCGKTTLGRIVSNELGCPIDSMDFMELDASTDFGVEAIRDLRSKFRYEPMESKCRVFLIDEIQEISSKKAQDGLLKPFEDTPAHVYFILCTTDPEKLTPALKSRCTKFKVEKLNLKETEQLINYVCNEEQADITPKALKKIVEVSDGHPREALVLLDQIIDLEFDIMDEVVERLETTEQQNTNLALALLKGKPWKEISGIINQLKQTEEAEKTRRGILGYMTKVALNNANPAVAINIIDCFSEPVFYTDWAGITRYCYDALGG